jgi:hypothetical protein
LINNPNHISESLETKFGLKYLNSLMRIQIRDLEFFFTLDPGSGITIPEQNTCPVVHKQISSYNTMSYSCPAIDPCLPYFCTFLPVVASPVVPYSTVPTCFSFLLSCPLFPALTLLVLKSWVFQPFSLAFFSVSYFSNFILSCCFWTRLSYHTPIRSLSAWLSVHPFLFFH